LGAQAADVLLEDELEDEPDDAEDAGFALLPESELLLSEPLLVLAAGLLPDDEPRLSVR
jgi:hypothetical protein